MSPITYSPATLPIYFYANNMTAHLQPDTVTEICWVLSYLTAGTDQFIGKLLDEGIAPLLVRLTPHLLLGMDVKIPYDESARNYIPSSHNFMLTCNFRSKTWAHCRHKVHWLCLLSALVVI
jgi:hypothetical protein